MNPTLIFFLLSFCIILLIGIILYQQFIFHTGTQKKLNEISTELKKS